MKIDNVKLLKDTRIQINFSTVPTGEEKPDEYVLKCNEEPAEGFRESLANLKTHVCTLEEFPDDFVTKIKVLGIEYCNAGENQVLGCQIEYERDLVKYKRPQKAKTKKYYIESDSGIEDYQVLPENAVGAIKTIIEEAEKYITGLRSKIDLFANTDQE